MAMTQRDTVDADVHVETIQVFLEPDRGTSWRGALLSAVIGAGAGPPYRFVAAAPDVRHDAAEHIATSQRFALEPFQDLDDPAADEWTDLARRRHAELDADLRRDGWRPADVGAHWWSLRYTR
ncbi:hypothetical protein ASC64_13930 [Nocardioides sp. Root122]|nr:hypothetical protein ASC64_13930 [Nocardioides sp. Root122]